MPTYEYRCQSTRRVFTRILRVADYQAPQLCSCGAASDKLISIPQIRVSKVDYTCPITGKYISTKHAHEDNLDRHGCRVLETGEKESNIQRKAREEAEFDKAIEDTVEREFEALPSEKKERLANELTSGVDIAIERI